MLIVVDRSSSVTFSQSELNNSAFQVAFNIVVYLRYLEQLLENYKKNTGFEKQLQVSDW